MSESLYAVNVTRSAQKDIRALDATTQVRVLRSIHHLSSEPRPAGCRKLIGAINRWRIRIGDYRVIYSIDDAARIIEIIAARHRSRAYE